MFLSWFVVTFKGTLPESLYEFEKDSLRVSVASSLYVLGLSDTYPSFAISMNHQTAKILLLIAGTILMISNSSTSHNKKTMTEYKYNFRYDNNNAPTTNTHYKTY